MTDKEARELAEAQRNNLGQFLDGEQHPNWKGDMATYSSIHKWLVLHFGNANRCEVCGNQGDDVSYEWAHTTDGVYHHSRGDFKMLCRPCHTKLDMTPEWRDKVSQGMRATRKVKKWSTPCAPETRIKISTSLKRAYKEERR